MIRSIELAPTLRLVSDSRLVPERSSRFIGKSLEFFWLRRFVAFMMFFLATLRVEQHTPPPGSFSVDSVIAAMLKAVCPTVVVVNNLR